MSNNSGNRTSGTANNKLKKISVYLLALLILSALVTETNAQKFQYFGTNLSDWATFTFPTAGGQIRWRILKNENPSPPGPGAATITDIPFGLTASELVPNQGNYTGDGADDFIVYRDNTGTPANNYIWRNADGSGTWTPWGNALTDFIGSEGDYDGDGKMDLTIVRAPTTSSPFVWWVLQSSNNAVVTFTFGTNATDIALPGADYTGDGKDDPTVARVNALSGAITWFVGTTTGAQLRQTQWGNFNTDFIVSGGDYDGDLKADFMVWRGFGAVNGVWYLQTNSGAVSYTTFGIPGGSAVRDTALRAGDYDGDGKTDIAIYRPSTLTFYVNRSSGGVQTQQWGEPGSSNLPIASFGIF